MLKSTFAPIFLTFPPKPSNLKVPPYAAISNVFTQRPPLIHQMPQSLQPTQFYFITAALQLAYVHLPFCRKRCHYCDFPIIALGSATPTDTDPRISNYVDLLQREILYSKPEFNAHPPLETVFFGGGTPSLVSSKLVSSILDTLRMKFGLCDDAEISMEMDPGTFDGKKLKEMMGLGVNRVSMGVQAFQEELLKSCGRAHGVREVYEAIEIIGSSGVENWSLDLISSLPHQTPKMWEDSLRLTVQAQPTHVSVYDLQVEQDEIWNLVYTRRAVRHNLLTSIEWLRRYSLMLITTIMRSAVIAKMIMNVSTTLHTGRTCLSMALALVPLAI